MFLVDTSAWIAHFSKNDELDLRDVCPAHDRILCLPVYQEILQGVRDLTALRRIRSILDAAEIVEAPLQKAVFDHAVELYRTARGRGITVRSSVDCLIAACAIRNDLTVLHRDRDYPALASVSTLLHQAV
jgi:predicted nucleic acid-binding protein